VAPTSLESEARESGGVAAPAPAVEVRRCGADSDEADVDVEAVADAGYVAEQATVTIDGVGRGFAGESDESPRREQALRDCRRLLAVALRREIDLGRVDLDEPDLRPVGEVDRVAVRDVVGASSRPTETEAAA
jgi:hypothetical protein